MTTYAVSPVAGIGIHTAQLLDRDAAAAWCAAQPHPSKQAEAIAIKNGEYDHHSLVQAFAEFRLAIAELILTDPNIAAALQQRICCNGVDCGCRGATVEEYLRYQLVERTR